MTTNNLAEGELPTAKNADRWLPTAVGKLNNPNAMKCMIDQMDGMFTMLSDDVVLSLLPTDKTRSRSCTVLDAMDLLNRASMSQTIMVPADEEDPDGEILMSEFMRFVSSCKCGDRYNKGETPRNIYDKYAHRLDRRATSFADVEADYYSMFMEYCNDEFGVSDDGAQEKTLDKFPRDVQNALKSVGAFMDAHDICEIAKLCDGGDIGLWYVDGARCVVDMNNDVVESE